MSDEDLIEAMRAASGYALHRDAARRVLDVVRPEGWRVVPEEPTTGMVEAAIRGIGMTKSATREALRLALLVGTPNEPGVAVRVRAAIAAAPSPPLPKTKDDEPMRETF